MSLIDKLEKKLGFLAIPNLLKIIAAFQFLVFLLVTFTTPGVDVASSGFFQKIALDPAAVFRGEIWRVFTFLLIPRTFSPWWILIMVLFMWMINDGLQQAWGVFKVNLFILSGAFMVVIGSLFLGAVPTGDFLFKSTILAFCLLYPMHQIMLMMLIPMQMRFLGIIMLAMMAFQLFEALANGYWPLVLAILLPLLNLALFVGPGLLRGVRQRAATAQRRGRFDAAQAPAGEAFYTCARCQKTDVTNPELEFRVTAEGDEVCGECREAG